jgi:hypothetical protein
VSKALDDGLCYSRLGGAKIAAPGSSVLGWRRVSPATPPMSRDLTTVARFRALKPIDTREPLPLDANVVSQIRGSIEAADREKGVA